MEEADALSNRILILDRGGIVALDTPAELKNVPGGDVIELSAGSGRMNVMHENTIWSFYSAKSDRRIN
jgi:ABC-type proline/glycine betaine transport system ATPase subunit